MEVGHLRSSCGLKSLLRVKKLTCKQHSAETEHMRLGALMTMHVVDPLILIRIFQDVNALCRRQWRRAPLTFVTNSSYMFPTTTILHSTESTICPAKAPPIFKIPCRYNCRSLAQRTCRTKPLLHEGGVLAVPRYLPHRSHRRRLRDRS